MIIESTGILDRLNRLYNWPLKCDDKLDFVIKLVLGILLFKNIRRVLTTLILLPLDLILLVLFVVK